MIAPAKRALAKQEAEIDIAATLSEPRSDPNAPIKSKRPRLRGRARAEVANNVAPTITGPKSKRLPKLAPGVRLVREYRGKKVTVLVIGERDFEYDGKRFRSLSAIANLVSHTHCNGLVWFGLRTKKEKAS